MGKKNKKKNNEKLAIDQSTIENCTPAKVVKTLEDTARLDTTPAGDYMVTVPAGEITLTKSGGEKGRLTWKLNGEKVTRSELYKITKDGKKASTEEKTDKKADKKKDKKKDKKADKKKADENGPSTQETNKTYKKKQLVKALESAQLFKKKLNKKIASAITEKTIAGSIFISIIDDIVGEETPIEKINQIFESLK